MYYVECNVLDDGSVEYYAVKYILEEATGSLSDYTVWAIVNDDANVSMVIVVDSDGESVAWQLYSLTAKFNVVSDNGVTLYTIKVSNSDDAYTYSYEETTLDAAADSVTVNETTYTLSSMGDLTSLDNNDYDGDVWGDGATDYVSVEGDFALYFTWTQSYDYPDNVLEMYDASGNYWDWTVVTNGLGWGDLLLTSDSDNDGENDANSNFTCNLESGEVSISTSGKNEGTSYCGTWEVYLVRTGSTLAVYVKGCGNGSTGYECHITQTEFTKDSLSVGINSNPAAGIDSGSLYYQLGSASSSSE